MTSEKAPELIWAAWDDRLGADSSPIGRGATEEAAIADLLDQVDAND